MRNHLKRLWTRWLAWSRDSPGAMVGHPVALASLAVLVVNDHVLKQLAPGIVTGKLSDVAGLVYFPMLLVAILELVRPAWVARRDVSSAMTCLVTLVAFGMVKTIPAATDAFNYTLGAMQWAISGGMFRAGTIVPTNVVTDPSDLLALPAVLLAFRFAGGRVQVMPGFRQRLSPLTIGILFVAGLASVATSPAMRSSSTSYEESLQLTREAPAVTRHLTLDITNRDTELADLVLLARSYTKGTQQGMPSELETEGVLVTLIPDDRTGQVAPSGQYMGPELSFYERCKESCIEGATVIVRLMDPKLAAAGPIATNLEVTLVAGASEEGTGPVDIDLGLANDVDQAFQGNPVEASTQRSGSVHVGADSPGFSEEFDIVIAAAALQEPYGYPLIGEIAVWHDNKTATGHPNAHGTAFEFTSPTRPPESYEYGWVDVGTGWLDEVPPPPTIVNLLPLCEPEAECRIRASLTSVYEDYLNDPDEPGQSPVLGSINFDWHLEVRLLTFDGRDLPEGAITIEPVD